MTTSPFPGERHRRAISRSRHIEFASQSDKRLMHGSQHRAGLDEAYAKTIHCLGFVETMHPCAVNLRSAADEDCRATSTISCGKSWVAAHSSNRITHEST